MGNRGPLKHGVYSVRHTEPIARQLVKDLRNEFDWLRAPRFKDTLWMYARTVAQSQVLDEWMADKTMEELTDSTGGKISPLELARKLAVRTGALALKLGLVPGVTLDVQEKIDKARHMLARRAEKAQLQADLKASIAEQWFGGDHG